MAYSLGFGNNDYGAFSRKDLEKEVNLAPDKKINLAKERLIDYYGDKADQDGDGKADHYRPDLVNLITKGNLGNNAKLEIKTDNDFQDDRHAEFRKPKENLTMWEKIKHKMGIDQNKGSIVFNEADMKDRSVNQVASSLAH